MTKASQELLLFAILLERERQRQRDRERRRMWHELAASTKRS